MKNNKPIIIWLLSGCVLIFLMVIIGGITRLTHSGLSISNYKLIMGIFPPMSNIEWESAFDLYKQYPEYQKLNSHFGLKDFKRIFFWEWLHRLIGRLVGFVFIVPFIYFLIKQKLEKSIIKKCIIIGILGGFQGILGWYMVKSGLIDNPDVSHYRLAAHLTTAFISFAYTFWVALCLIYPKTKNSKRSPLFKWVTLLLFVLFFQIIWGAFVAGLDAGLIHNHWPMMNDGAFIHDTVFIEKPSIIQNFVEGKSGVQFIHRMGGILVFILIAYLFYKSKKEKLNNRIKKVIYRLSGMVILQFLLGVSTLLFHVPIWLGLAHQIGAFILLGFMMLTLYHSNFYKAI